jgi:hypothetical protein
MKLLNLKFTLLSMTCLSGLVSCYPLDPNYPNGREVYRPSGLMTQAELDAAAQQREAESHSEVTAMELSKERLEREEKERLEKEKLEAAGISPNTGNRTNTGTATERVVPPVTPATVKFAAPVPDKPGFVYNPFTQNQVDVRGIPSGTKVRDPHDSNPAHIFKVP